MAKRTIEYTFSMESASLIGFSNQLKDYQMAYYLNKEFKLDFSREEDFQRIIKESKKKKIVQPTFYLQSEDTLYYYPFFSYFDEQNLLMYLLLGTYSEGICLHDTLKTFDKLLFIFGRDHKDAVKYLQLESVKEEIKKEYKIKTSVTQLGLQKRIPKTLAVRLFDFSSIQAKATKESEEIYLVGQTQLNMFEEQKPLASKKLELAVSKEDKQLLKTYNFLNNELLHEIEMFFNEKEIRSK